MNVIWSYGRRVNMLNKEVITALNAVNYAILAFERYVKLDDEGKGLLKTLKEKHINYGKALVYAEHIENRL